MSLNSIESLGKGVNLSLAGRCDVFMVVRGRALEDILWRIEVVGAKGAGILFAVSIKAEKDGE